MGNCEHLDTDHASTNNRVFVRRKDGNGNEILGHSGKTFTNVFDGDPKGKLLSVDITGTCNKTHTDVTNTGAEQFCFNNGENCPYLKAPDSLA